MLDILQNFLDNYKKKTILLSELEKAVPGNISYDKFAQGINTLVEDKVLTCVNPKNNNGKSIPLCMKYKINKYELKKEGIEEIREMSLKIHSAINLEEYYKLNISEFEKDKKYIVMIDTYLKENGIPQSYATSPERSFNITGDEKWIDEKDGKKLLQRLKIYDVLKIINVSDPLMFAVNPKCINDLTHYHLIVENKATFLAMTDYINETKFTSLILGYGWKINGNIFMLERQLNLKGKNIIYYFGDLDNEGISIYNSLNERTKVILADKFYKELLKKPFSVGKENQNFNEEAVNNFLKYFSEPEREYILDILKNGKYMPQEALSKEELKSIWNEIIH